MKHLGLILITSIATSAFGGEFTFTPHLLLFDSRIEHITAELQINKTKQTCLVDTGARYSIAKVAILNDLEKVGEVLGGGISNPNIITDLVQTNLTVGEWNLTNAVVGRSDRIPFPCLIGNDFFLGKSFHLSFKKNAFSEIEPLNVKAENFNLDVYQDKQWGHFGFEVQVADQLTKSIFDTGASHTVIDANLITLQPNQFTFIKDLSATDGNSVVIKAVLYRLKHFKFADVDLKDIEVIAVDLSSLKSKLPLIDVVIGMDIIQKYNWSFDTKSQLWNHGGGQQ